MRNQIKAHLAILTANVMYGINYIAVKQVLPEHASWQGLALLRATGALLLFWIISLFLKHEKIPRKELWKICIAGLLGVTINQSLLVWGIEKSSPVNASIIMTLNPLFVMILSAIILKFPITKLKVLGTVIGGSGALLLILSASHSEYTGTHTIGDFIILTNAVMYGLYLVWTKPLMKKYGAFTVLKYMFLFGSIPVFFYGSGPALDIQFSELSLLVYGSILFVVVGATFITYMCNIIGLKYVNPTTVSIYIYLQPIIATVIAILIGQDTFSWHKIVSMILVFAGVYLVTLTNKEPKQSL